jgi:hypothetical protein
LLEWVCLVNMTTIEVKLLVPLVRFHDCAPFGESGWLKLMRTLIRNQVEQPGESGEYWMGMVRVV